MGTGYQTSPPQGPFNTHQERTVTSGPMWDPPPTEGVQPYRFKWADAVTPEDTKERTAIAMELMAELNPDVPEHVTQWWAQDALNQRANAPTVEEIGAQAEQGHRQATVRRTINHQRNVERYGARDYTESNREWLERKATQDRELATRRTEERRKASEARKAAVRARRARMQERTQLAVEPYDVARGRYQAPSAKSACGNDALVDWS